jgi:phosphoribosylanthranilate isomerase
VKVKICGITNLDDALFCCNSGAEALGFIFYEKSKRYIHPREARNILSALPALLMKVGVFVDEDAEKVNETAKYTGLNAVQLHGNEDVNYTEKISLPVIKAFRVKEGFNFKILDDFTDCGWMLDTDSIKEHGGTGTAFSWNIIPEQIRNEIILAGGINSDNIGEVFDKIKPAAVDLSSSLESSPGRKDKNKVTDFMNKLKELRGY